MAKHWDSFLSYCSQEIALHIGEALGQKLDVSGKMLQDQLWDLIIQPLQSCKRNLYPLSSLSLML